MTGKEYCRLCKQSPDTAYRALFDEYLSYVYTIVYNKLRSCASAQDIEECVSDVFAEMYMKYDIDSEFSGELHAYIGTIAKRKAINRYHHTISESRHIEAIEESEWAAINSGQNVTADSEKSEIRNIMLDKINELGEPDTTIIIQKFYYDRSSIEIADMLSMNAPAVRMRCKRAMARLRSLLEAVGITL